MTEILTRHFGHATANSTNSINILFLGDGFGDNLSDKNLFYKIVDGFPSYLSKVEPFNWKKKDDPTINIMDRIIIYSAYLVSNDRGVHIDESVILRYKQTPGDFYELIKSVDNKLPGNERAVTSEEKNTKIGLAYKFDDESKRFAFHFKDNNYIKILSVIASLRYPAEGAQSYIPFCWLNTTLYKVNLEEFEGPKEDVAESYRYGQEKNLGLTIVLVNTDLNMANTIAGNDPNTIDSIEKFKAICVAIGVGKTDVIKGKRGVNTKNQYHHEPMDYFVNGKIDDINLERIYSAILHEIGHSFFGLADEYSGGAKYDIDLATRQYDEPNIASVTDIFDVDHVKDGNGKIIGFNIKALKENAKWVPSMLPEVRDYIKNERKALDKGELQSDCVYPPQPGEIPEVCGHFISEFDIPEGLDEKQIMHKQDLIGLFEGARYQCCWFYRPSPRCKMRSISDKVRTTSPDGKVKESIVYGVPFCYVCKKQILQVIFEKTEREGDSEFRAVIHEEFKPK